jgi:nicotinate-nucleotide adenylyltransferase
MTKICFGGSFNPIHVGHLMVARAVAEARGFDRIVLVPSAQPPHKPNAADLAGSRARLRMCQIVTEGDSLFEVCDFEILRDGPSYTLDTARQLKNAGWQQVAWLIGADMVQILPQWHRPLELLKEVRFFIAERPGYEIEWAGLPVEFQSLRQNVVRAPLFEISASQIRERVKRGHSIRYMVPPEVERYIFDQKLYQK